MHTIDNCEQCTYQELIHLKHAQPDTGDSDDVRKDGPILSTEYVTCTVRQAQAIFSVGEETLRTTKWN